jgi:hypothetical protein
MENITKSQQPISNVDFQKMFKNMNDKIISLILISFTLIILIIFICYWLIYIRNLKSNECSLLNNIYSKMNGNLRSINSNDPRCKHTLKDYYIKTAYNCCNGGSYSNDFVDICVLKDILKQGVRCLDFEIFSINDIPVIASSLSDNYYIKETYNSVNFLDALNVIQYNGFNLGNSPNPNDPIILHLRFKSSNQKMYENMASILEKYNSILLDKSYSYENNQKNLGDVPLLQFMNKIIIIVDMNNSEFLKCQNFLEYVNMTSNSLYMRALSYYDVQYTPDLNELIEYNKSCMTLALPNNLSNPPNMSGILARETGTQFCAMRYQLFDTFLEENELFFDNESYAFVLKPANLRFSIITVDTPPPQDPSLSYSQRTVTSNYYSFNI